MQRVCTHMSIVSDLLLHNNVWQLSKENVLQRFFDLLNEIKLFLIKSTHLVTTFYSKFLDDNINVVSIAFLADIFQHINFMKTSKPPESRLSFDVRKQVFL